jgi:hypothetical protein
VDAAGSRFTGAAAAGRPAPPERRWKMLGTLFTAFALVSFVAISARVVAFERISRK